MNLTDNVSLKGYFSIKCIHKDGTIDEYTEKNLIMDTARNDMTDLIGGRTIGSPINKLVLGNKGHIGTDILNYKKVGEEGFVTNKTSLFSEEGKGTDYNDKEDFVYEITFNPNGSDTTVVDDAAVGSVLGSDETDICNVQRTITDNVCSYKITIPDYAGNKPGDGAVVAYTEAALYAGDRIFSMKTFSARVKEDTVKIEITWNIVF
jgi:hypothetical protein